MRKNIFALVIFSLVLTLCVSSCYPAFGVSYNARINIEAESESEDDELTFSETVIGIIGLGIICGTFYFFWKVFKTIIIILLWPFKKLREILGIKDSPKTQTVIINLPAMNLKPVKQYYRLDPEFDSEGIKALTANLYVRIQNAWQAKDISSLRPYMTDDFYSYMNEQLDAFKKQNKTEYTENIAVLSVTLKGWRQASGMDYMTVWLNSRINSYVLDDVTGKLLSGDKASEKFIEYEIDLSRKRGIVTAPKSDNVHTDTCPNCGAPVNINNSARCEYCGSVINQVNIDWAICAIRKISQRNS